MLTAIIVDDEPLARQRLRRLLGKVAVAPGKEVKDIPAFVTAELVAAASTQNRPRQPTTGISHCTGRVDATMPSEPDINIQELARNCAAGVNQRR